MNQKILKPLSHWRQYHPKLCLSCTALCCYLPVEVTLSDLSHAGVISPLQRDETYLDETIKELKRRKIIIRYNSKTKMFTLGTRADGGCLFLDHQNRCTIYEKRPQTCQKFPNLPPFNKRCPYEKDFNKS